MIEYASPAERLMVRTLKSFRKTKDVGSNTYLGPEGKHSSLTQNVLFLILFVSYLYLRGSRGGARGGLCFAKRHLDQQFARGFLNHALHGHTLCGLPDLPTTYRRKKQLLCSTNTQDRYSYL